MLLDGKVALVTGASRGIGRAIALRLAAEGAKVVINYLKNEAKGLDFGSDAAAVVAEIQRRYGTDAVAVAADLASEQQILAMFDAAEAKLGPVDILVNNAGTIRRAPAAEHPASDWDEVLAVNLDSVFHLSQAVGRGMIERGRGRIVNVASMLSFQGGILVPGYTASKHAVAGLTKALANEWASKGITVNAIAPGYMNTNNTAALRADEVRSKQILDRIPAGRWGLPSDLAGAAVFLCSSASDYVTGHVLVVDGGWLAR